MIAIFIAILAALIAFALTALYLRAMTASGRLEQPSERGMHSVPVPSGAGIAIVAATVLLWPISQDFALERTQVVLLAALAALAALSWFDDHYRLAPIVRLAAHALAVTVLLALLDSDQRVLPAIPIYIERAMLGLGWLWFINLFNFMDGIDGLASCEAIAVAAGYFTVIAAAPLDTSFSALALILAAAVGGYLFWNRYPAKVFMGDAGSIPLGFLLGWLMIDLAFRGYWAAAVILPLYFTADATLTLLKRLRRGEKPWQPHREHFYQRAVLAGATPPAVVRCVNAVNVMLIVLALLSMRFPGGAIAAAVAVVAGLLIHLQRVAGDWPA